MGWKHGASLATWHSEAAPGDIYQAASLTIEAYGSGVASTRMAGRLCYIDGELWVSAPRRCSPRYRTGRTAAGHAGVHSGWHRSPIGQACAPLVPTQVCEIAAGLQPAGRAAVHDALGVTDRTRTGDLRGHNPALDQLSFRHSARTWTRTRDTRCVGPVLLPLSYTGIRRPHPTGPARGSDAGIRTPITWLTARGPAVGRHRNGRACGTRTRFAGVKAQRPTHSRTRGECPGLVSNQRPRESNPDPRPSGRTRTGNLRGRSPLLCPLRYRGCVLRARFERAAAPLGPGCSVR